MRRLFLTVLILSITQSIYAGWVRIYGGIHRDAGQCVRQTSDGGYIVAGSGHSYGPEGGALWLLKTDANGDTMWMSHYVGVAYSVQETLDGGYIVAAGTNDGLHLLKTDSAGEKLWSIFNESFRTYSYWATETDDGNYVACGYGVLKTDPSGKVLWERHYGRVSRFVEQTSDGGYIICGLLTGGYFLLYKTDELGNTSWWRYYGVGGSPPSDGYCTRETEDGGYIAVGYSAGDNDLWIIKTDSQGDTLWTRTYGGKESDYGRFIRITPDDDYIIAGYTYSYGPGEADFWLIRTDAEGNVQWSRTYGGPDDDFCYCVDQTSDGGYIIVGKTKSFGHGSGYWASDLLLIKTDSLGRVWPIEISPTKLFAPTQDVELTEMIPKARFTNLSTCNYNGDIYCHFEIVGIDHHGADRHDSVLVHGLKAWESVDLEFSEWSSDHISAYKATFYVTSTTGDSIPCHPLSVTFFRGSEVEEQAFVAPSLELITSVGSQIILRYSDCPQGFAATVFDASGRKVDELYSTQQSGTVTWGKEYSPGVYFIRPTSGGELNTLKVILTK